jgi:hypothetical protein
MARSIPKIRDDSLHVLTLEGHGTSVIALGSTAWDSWVEHARSFRFETPHTSFTALQGTATWRLVLVCLPTQSWHTPHRLPGQI